MIAFPNAKINIGLNILGKRADGYHNILSCFYPVPWTDILEINPADQMKFESSGIPIPGKPEENLCFKAYKLLAADFSLPPVHIHLHKLIPIGAGLGGGSADASFSLIMLNRLFNLFLDHHVLEDYAVKLGSDCPFFIDNQPKMVYGKGDKFDHTSLDLEGKVLVLVYPDLHISTAEAYKGLQKFTSSFDLKGQLETQPVDQWKDWLRNDFEASILPNNPMIGEIKDALYASGAHYSSMTGSGAAVFGIFSQKVDLSRLFPENYLFWQDYL
ncbi:MAG: 4-(cytidine 5'-diphospho)-2-C-methyl-D-erythritol kinase [Candidatus Cyclobacteriaceae bacterium M3_2C_046]